MSKTSETLRIAALTAHVPEALAAEVKALAEQGERSISREVTLALRRHIAAQGPDERRAPETSSPAVEARAHAGGPKGTP